MKLLTHLNALLLAFSTIVLIGLQESWGWGLILVGTVTSLIFERTARVHFLLLYFCLGVLGLIHINTDLSNQHMLSMSVNLMLVLGVTYYGTKVLTPTKALNIKWHWAELKKRINQYYFALGLLIGIPLIPYYFWQTSAYLNWTVEFSAAEIVRLFVGTNGLGIWDELFFINVVFVLLRYHLNFWAANLIQAVLFSTFLFELGFTGWGPIMIYVFALIQGYMYEKNESLGLVLVLHLIFDLILFLSLLYWHWVL